MKTPSNEVNVTRNNAWLPFVPTRMKKGSKGVYLGLSNDLSFSDIVSWLGQEDARVILIESVNRTAQRVWKNCSEHVNPEQSFAEDIVEAINTQENSEKLYQRAMNFKKQVKTKEDKEKFFAMLKEAEAKVEEEMNSYENSI